MIIFKGARGGECQFILKMKGGVDTEVVNDNDNA